MHDTTPVDPNKLIINKLNECFFLFLSPNFLQAYLANRTTIVLKLKGGGFGAFELVRLLNIYSPFEWKNKQCHINLILILIIFLIAELDTGTI